MTYAGRRVLLAAAAGARAGDLANDPWGQVRLEYAANTFLRLEASAGTYPRDLTGFTDGLFVQAGIRLAAGAATRRDARPPPTARPVAVRPAGDARVRVTVRYGRAVQRLAIAGDFSNWEPIPLRRSANGEWTAQLALEPGIHKYALIADGAWTLPDGVAAIDDGLGGKVGVLVVPPS